MLMLKPSNRARNGEKTERKREGGLCRLANKSIYCLFHDHISLASTWDIFMSSHVLYIAHVYALIGYDMLIKFFYAI